MNTQMHEDQENTEEEELGVVGGNRCDIVGEGYWRVTQEKREYSPCINETGHWCIVIS